MKFPKPKTFWGAISPTILTRWAFGTGVFEYPADCPRRVLSLFWSVAWLIVLLVFVWVLVLKEMWDTRWSSFFMTNYYIVVIVFVFSDIAAIYRGHARSKKFKDCILELDRVNEMFSKLGILGEYEPVFKSQVVHLIGIFVFVLAALLMTLNTLSSHSNISIPLFSHAISTGYQVITSLLDDRIFCSCIRYIRERFQHLNALLIKSGIDAENPPSFLRNTYQKIPWLLPPALDIHPQSRYVSIAVDQWIMARKVHHDLCSLAEDLNEVFGIQILFTIAISFSIITICLFDIHFRLSAPAESTVYKIRVLIAFVPWICLHALKVFTIISTCSKTSTEAQLTGELIYERITPATCSEIREEIYAFSLQLIENPLRFTARGFFTLDFTMIYGMLGTVVTYLTVMIQAAGSPPK